MLPQALRTIFPALGNYALVLIKETSLVAVISVYADARREMLAGATFQALTVTPWSGSSISCCAACWRIVPPPENG